MDFKSLLEWCEGIAPVSIRDDWRSLGTYVRAGRVVDGVIGPAIVISGQVADLHDSPVAFAIVLHECGHALDPTPRPFEGTLEERAPFERAANTIAAALIVEHFADEWWATEAFDYLLWSA